MHGVSDLWTMILCVCGCASVSIEVRGIIIRDVFKVMSNLMAKGSCREAYALLPSIFFHSVGYILLILNKSTWHQVSQPKDKRTEWLKNYGGAKDSAMLAKLCSEKSEYH